MKYFFAHLHTNTDSSEFQLLTDMATFLGLDESLLTDVLIAVAAVMHEKASAQ